MFHLFLSLSLVTTTCSNWLFLPPSILSYLPFSPFSPSPHPLATAYHHQKDLWPNTIALLLFFLSAASFSFSCNPSSLCFLLPALSLQLPTIFTLLLLYLLALLSFFPSNSSKSATCTGRSSLITNKENPFGAGFSDPLWTLLSKNGPHLCSCLLSVVDSPSFSLIIYPCFSAFSVS